MLNGGATTPRGHGRLNFRNGDYDQGDVICFAVTGNVAQFTIDVSKKIGGDEFLLVRVQDDVIDTLTYQRLQLEPDCTIALVTPTGGGPVSQGNIVVSDGN